MTTESELPGTGTSARDHEFDIVVSFAGEDRELVSEIVNKCKDRGYSIFYDEDEVAALWGEDLAEYFADTYENRSRAALMFVSEHYERKPWTTHERRSILLRALNQAPDTKLPYMFPIRVDDTNLSGLRTSIGYVDSRKYTTDQIVEFVEKKIGPPAHQPTTEIDRTPRTAEECGVLLSQRPPAWEYFYTAYLMIEEVESRRQRKRDFECGFFVPGDYVEPADAVLLGGEEISRVLGIVESFNGLLGGPLQQEAWGLPGQAGNAEAIEYLADRYGKLLDMLLDWANRVGGYVTSSPEAKEYLRALVRYAEQPIESLCNFPQQFRRDVDGILAALDRGEESVELTLTIEWSVPHDVSKSLENAREALAMSLAATQGGIPVAREVVQLSTDDNGE
ncbi:MAG: hypothetical protein CMJ85_14105 [Planctomycetes bacterium]|nr:hypothetical protein [Planctomycetota bacterium]